MKIKHIPPLLILKIWSDVHKNVYYKSVIVLSVHSSGFKGLVSRPGARVYIRVDLVYTDHHAVMKAIISWGNRHATRFYCEVYVRISLGVKCGREKRGFVEVFVLKNEP